ncbi:peptidoglycan DD-metalloendopeptidase family protein [Paenalcaligenes hominis]|uniref:peptidoglycan DD-metalloendopeptidase family protein n=1 Tax=Paenalcaligenes hominis TaxID=643674 RepID=UPI0035245FEC
MQQAGTTMSPAASILSIRQPTRWLVAGTMVMSLVLSGCSTNTPAPITDIHSSTPSAPQSTTGGNYTVQVGDTLYKIAQQHGTTVQAIANANNITDPSQLRVGQVLVVNGAGQVAQTSTSTSRPSTTPASSSDSGAATSSPVTSSSSTSPTSSASVSTKSPRASDANLINWGWPTNGKIIQSFTASTKGIDLEGNVGDAVNAAADGKVMYAGNGVRGLGNLILLGHSNGFITAYAHNDSLIVKTGQEIKKGQRIATLGQSDTTSPRLHFEIRRRGTPVNPLSYLPER